MALRYQMIASASEPARGDVVLFHGFRSSPDDLAPFAKSLGLPRRFFLPEGPHALLGGGRGFWPIDEDARAAAVAKGPRDLSDFRPEGLAHARDEAEALLDTIAETSTGPLVLGGFSQGAMLACDLALRSSRPLGGLVLASGARICRDEWAPLTRSRRGLPVLMTHGRSDPDLSFAAAEAFARELEAAGLSVTFVAFEGGHEIPLVAWRAIKRFLAPIVRDP